MPKGSASVEIKVTKPGGTAAASKEFTDLARAANEAAKAVKSAKSAGSAYAEQLARENSDSRRTKRKESAAERNAAIDAAAAERKRNAITEHKEQQHRYAAQRNIIGSSARGGVGGALGAIGGKAGVAGAVIEAVGVAMDKAAKGAEILNDSYQTSAQKLRGFVSEFVPLGDKFIKLGDALDGTADAINRNKERFDIARAQDEARATARAKIGSASLQDYGYKAQFAATQRIGIAGFDTFDRTTLAGERAAGIQDTTIGARDQLTGAQRGHTAALMVKKAADDAVKEAEKRVREQQNRVNAAEGELGANTKMENRGFRDKAGRDFAGRTVELERARLAQELAARESLIATAKEKGVAAIEAEKQMRASMIELAKSELAVLEQQETRMRGMAQTTGAMSQGEFMAAANALKSYQEAGGNAPPEIEALVSRIAPDLVRKNQENRGAGRFDELRGVLGDKGFSDAFGEDFGRGNSLKEVMAKVDKAKADVRVTIDLDTQSTAKQLSEILKPVLQNLIGSLQVEIKNLEGRIKAGNVVRNNAAN